MEAIMGLLDLFLQMVLLYGCCVIMLSGVAYMVGGPNRASRVLHKGLVDIPIKLFRAILEPLIDTVSKLLHHLIDIAFGFIKWVFGLNRGGH
jgi:hypothetical protein